jgi:hypothetical protein
MQSLSELWNVGGPDVQAGFSGDYGIGILFQTLSAAVSPLVQVSKSMQTALTLPPFPFKPTHVHVIRNRYSNSNTLPQALLEAVS